MQSPTIHTTIALTDQSTPAEIRAAISHLHMLLADAPHATVDKVDVEHIIHNEGRFEELPPEVQAPLERTPAEIFGGIKGNVIAEILKTQETPLPPQGQLLNADIPPPPPVQTTFVQAPPPPANVERDRDGHVWDERIHSSTRAKNKDGTWRGRRNLDPAIIAQVNAERGNGAAGMQTPVANPVVPPPPAATHPAPMIPALGAMTFSDVIKKVQAEISAGKLTQPTVTEECRKLGLASLPDLGKRPDLFGAFLTNLGIA